MLIQLQTGQVEKVVHTSQGCLVEPQQVTLINLAQQMQMVGIMEAAAVLIDRLNLLILEHQYREKAALELFIRALLGNSQAQGQQTSKLI